MEKGMNAARTSALTFMTGQQAAGEIWSHEGFLEGDAIIVALLEHEAQTILASAAPASWRGDCEPAARV